MPIERAVYKSSAWQVYWTAPGQVPPPPPNGPPVASFTSTTSGTTVSFDGSASHGTGGVAIVSYLWDFGDGKKSTASASSAASHTYAASGTFTVNLLVTAADKQTASASASVKITIVNKPPVAAFSASVSGLTVAVDATSSSDPDGQIASYAWNFGDGATASGVTASHAYTSGGTKNISLTVTDNLGGTGAATHSVVLSTVPVADFTFSVSGNTLSVDASKTTDTNPISSYSWDWNESTTVPTYSFDTANDKHIVTLHPHSGNVLQCAIKNPDTGNIYSTQTGNGSNGSSTPYESTYLSRMDSTGALIDWVKLIDGGHGTSFALEFTNSKTYIWMTWQAPATTGGTHDDIVRFPYPVGANKEYTRASPPPGMTVPYPGGLNNGFKTDVQFDVGKNRVVLRSGGPSGYNTYRQGVLSDFLAKKLTIYNTVVVPSGPPTLQGYFTYDYSLFIYWGVASGPTVNTTDPPVLKEYRWIDGKEIASYDPSWWGKPYADGHYEPESSTLYHPSGGSPYAWVGFITGTTNAYKQDLLQVPLIEGSQSIPDPPGSGKTASHTYSNAGTYNVTLTVKDAVGQTDTQTKGVTIGTAVNKPPVASFASSATNLTANVDASGSTDSDGTIVSYAWDFGDGMTGSGVTAAHTYATGGTFTVKLTVTDNDGASASVTHSVTVSNPQPPPGPSSKSPWTTGSPTEGFPSTVPVIKARTLQPSGTLDLAVMVAAMTSDAVIDISGQHVTISSFNGGNLAAVNGGSHFLGLLGGISNGVFDNQVVVQPNIFPSSVISAIQGNQSGTSQYAMIRTAAAIGGTHPVYFMGVHFIGADQGHVTDAGSAQIKNGPARYKGIDMDLAQPGLFQNCLLEGFNYSDGSTPPWEVGMVDSRRCHGFTVRRVELNGQLPVGSPSRPSASSADPFGLNWYRSGGFQWNADANTVMQDFSIHDGLVSGLTYSIASVTNSQLGPTGNNSGNITLNNLYVENQSQHGFSGINLEDVMGYVHIDHPTIKMNGSGGNHIGWNNRLGGTVPVISSANFVITEPTWTGGPAGSMFSIRIAGSTQWPYPPTVIKNGVKLTASTSTGLDPTKFYHVNNVS